jgi:hypothetical protein
VSSTVSAYINTKNSLSIINLYERRLWISDIDGSASKHVLVCTNALSAAAPVQLFIEIFDCVTLRDTKPRLKLHFKDT